MTRQKWSPTNGSDGMFLDDYCSDCLHDIDQSCPLIAHSLVAKCLDEMPEEWTAEDCTGRGFRCAKKQPL